MMVKMVCRQQYLLNYALHTQKCNCSPTPG